ncbi:hypothetical protein [Pedobacter psychroterrae]|uniref:Aminotransferase class I and II n=1 Tax=Pedobacter psychroterrae TaxID=2530453 RepID=A0A4R0NN27_9SPHI|nr:hypothetical protein [Pedobacter psychroterrae]TCD00535.1 hypothetical protein EZ437_15055 [Pedobacter psychroterrae]
MKSAGLFTRLSRLNEVKVSQIVHGTNQFNVSLAKNIDPAKLNKRLREKHNIVFGLPKSDSFVKIKINPTLLRRDNHLIFDSFAEAIAFSKM